MAMSLASQRATHVAASRARPSSRRSARVTAFLSNSEGTSSAQVRGQVSTSAAASFAAFSALAQQPMRQEQGGATWLAQLRDLFSPASKPREEWELMLPEDMLHDEHNHVMYHSHIAERMATERL